MNRHIHEDQWELRGIHAGMHACDMNTPVLTHTEEAVAPERSTVCPQLPTSDNLLNPSLKCPS